MVKSFGWPLANARRQGTEKANLWFVNFVLTHRTSTRVLFVVIPFLVLWTIFSVVIRWAPGFLDAIKLTIATVPEIFWFGSVLPGAVLSVYFSIRGAHHLWVWSATIYDGLDE